MALAGAVWSASSRANIGLFAAGAAFYGLLAVFPALAAIVILWGFLADPEVVRSQLAFLVELLPEETRPLLTQQTERFITNPAPTHGAASLVSVLVALWSARLGISALLQGLNTVYGVPHRSGFWHTLTALSMTCALIAASLVAIFATLVVPIVVALVPLGTGTTLAINAGKWAVAAAVLILGLGFVYRYGPNRRLLTPWLSGGLWLAVGLWLASSLAFNWYLGAFGDYNRIYGALGAPVILLLWFYIAAYAVLLGAVVNAEAERTPDDKPAQAQSPSRSGPSA